MDESRLDRSLQALPSIAGRRDAFRSLSADSTQPQVGPRCSRAQASTRLTYGQETDSRADRHQDPISHLSLLVLLGPWCGDAFHQTPDSRRPLPSRTHREDLPPPGPKLRSLWDFVRCRCRRPDLPRCVS
jgi:hypothetical protein